VANRRRYGFIMRSDRVLDLMAHRKVHGTGLTREPPFGLHGESRVSEDCSRNVGAGFPSFAFPWRTVLLWPIFLWAHDRRAGTIAAKEHIARKEQIISTICFFSSSAFIPIHLRLIPLRKGSADGR